MKTKKIISGSKYVFLNYLKGEVFAWLTNNTNYKNAATKDQLLRELTPWRWKQVFPYKKTLPWYELPTQIIDGLMAGEYIKKYFINKYPNFKVFDVDEEESNWNLKSEYTKKILNDHSDVIIFEPLFEYKLNDYSFKIKGDVLIKENEKIHLIEAKAVTVPLIYHAIDVKYQKEIIKRAGYDVDNWEFSLGIMNKEFCLELNSLWEIKDLFSIWKSYFKTMPNNLQESLNQGKDFSLNEFISSKAEIEYFEFANFNETLEKLISIQLLNEPPIEGIKKTFNQYLKSDYIKWALKINGLIPKSVFEFAGDSGFDFIKKVNLWSDGIKLMKNASKESILPRKISENHQLMSLTNEELIKNNSKSAKRLIQKMYISKKEPFILKDKISKWIEAELPLDKPVIMFDFETVSLAIPMIRCSKPYEQVPYQFSAHIITNPKDFDWESGKNVEHYEFLTKSKDFYKQFWEEFVKVMFRYPDATFVSYNKSFENAIAKNALKPEKQNYISNDVFKKIEIIKNQTIDLMDIFINRWYYHDDFNGSYSIKAVSTHFAPKIKYSNLDDRIQKGDQSALQAKIWLYGLNDKFDKKNNLILEKLYDNDTPISNKQWFSIRKSMLEYCKYDTLAMVAILQNLLKLIM